MGFQQIQAPTLRELFVDQVIGMIFSGELRVGDRLPSERELSEQMHISRSMVHTGLEDLERMGFVRMEPRRGNYIEDYARHGNFETLMALGKYGGQFDHAIESSLVEARDAIEGGAMILLGERGTPADIDQLRAITDGLRASVAAGDDAGSAAQDAGCLGGGHHASQFAGEPPVPPPAVQDHRFVRIAVTPSATQRRLAPGHKLTGISPLCNRNCRAWCRGRAKRPLPMPLRFAAGDALRLRWTEIDSGRAARLGSGAGFRKPKRSRLCGK